MSPEVRPRDPPASRGTTERSAYGTVTDPAGAGYVVRSKNGRRNRCQPRAHPAPLRRAVVEGSRYGGAGDRGEVELVGVAQPPRSVPTLVNRLRPLLQSVGRGRAGLGFSCGTAPGAARLR